MRSATQETGAGLSVLVRERSADLHRETMDAPFLRALLRGTLDRAAYAALLGQLRFVYEVLEASTERWHDDPVAGAFHHDALARVPAIEADLEVLVGLDWSVGLTPSPATTAYCARLTEVTANWAGGFVAHHYVRYLGDLSGGRAIGAVVRRTYDLTEQAGGRFATFDALGDVEAFKARYRAALDAAPFTADEQERICEEVLLAYRLNDAVFADLAPLAAPADAAPVADAAALAP